MKGIWKKIAVTFIVGLIVGMAIGRWTVRHGWHRFESREKRFERKFQRFSKKLDLSEDQKVKVKKLFKQKHKKMKALHEETKPQFQTIRDNVHSEIRLMLKPDQQKTFDQLEEKKRERRKNKRKHFRHKSW